MTSYTTNLDIALLDANTMAPEDVVNDGLDAVDSKICGTVICAFAGNTVTLTQDQQALGSIFHCTAASPGPTLDPTLTFAAFGLGKISVINDTGLPLTVTYPGQSLTPPVIDAGVTAALTGDGSNIRADGAASAGSGGGIISAIQASEDIAAGAMVNIWNSGGARMRNANATDNTKPAHGFVVTGVASGNVGIFYGSGQIISGLVGLTPGAFYYLDVTNGAVTSVAPSSSGNLAQQVGVAISATKLAFYPMQGFTI